jgi:renalase
LWNRDIGLGVCGDWLLGPRVECAWLSGRQLAKKLVEAAGSQSLEIGSMPAIADTGLI